MTSDKDGGDSAERTRSKSLQVAIEQGRRSGLSDRSAEEIRAEAKAKLRSMHKEKHGR